MSNKPNVIVTGGTGFIGSHICIELSEYFELVIIDNLYNSCLNTVEKIEKLISKKVDFYKEDLLNKDKIESIFAKYEPYAVIHLAGLKSVNESIQKPLCYYMNNLYSTINLLEVMKKYQCFNLIFSSSATVYGRQSSPLRENTNIGDGITNPYGQTKYMIEKILGDICVSDTRWNVISLRYFNPVGAHPSGLIGENPNDIPNNLLPYILKVSVNNNTDTNLGTNYDRLKIFGNNYLTEDGTCERDFIHIVDLAKGHLAAILQLKSFSGYNVFNLGTGKPVSVLKFVNTFTKVNKLKLPYQISERRPGDLPVCFCDTSYSEKMLNWKAEKTLSDICIDSWKFQNLNPNGY